MRCSSNQIIEQKLFLNLSDKLSSSVEHQRAIYEL